MSELMEKQNLLWDSERNFFNADEYFQTLIEDINNAQHYVFLESYIFEADLVGLAVIQALIAAKQRGLEIKVLIDGLGSINTMNQLLTQFQEGGVFLKVYHPLPWDFKSHRYSVNKGSFIEKFLHFAGRINHRDHRKLCIIDGSIAWTGSLNISKSHLALNLQGDGWKDHGVRVTGSKVNLLSEEFLQLWSQKSYKRFRHPFKFILSTLNPIKRKQKILRVTQAIDTAQKRIWIANAYFAPHRSIIESLIKAKQRGIDVRVIVGGKSDVFFFPSLTRSFYLDLIGNNIAVYEWSKGILHSKIFLYDHCCYSGSSNLNNRSHVHDLELDILLCQEKTILEIEKGFRQDFKNSIKIEFDYLHDNAFYIFLMGLVPKLLRYWL